MEMLRWIGWGLIILAIILTAVGTTSLGLFVFYGFLALAGWGLHALADRDGTQS